MSVRPPLLLPALVALLGASLPACKSERTVISEHKSVDPIREKFAGNFDVVTDENGVAKVKSDKRSSFESKMFHGGEAQAPTKDFKTKPFNGLKEFKTSEAKGVKDFKTSTSRYEGQASRYNQTWGGAEKTSPDADKVFAKKDFATKDAREDGKAFPTKVAPDARGDTRFHDPALDNIRPAGAGEGGNPTVKDIRDLIGKGPGPPSLT